MDKQTYDTYRDANARFDERADRLIKLGFVFSKVESREPITYLTISLRVIVHAKSKARITGTELLWMPDCVFEDFVARQEQG